MSDLEPRRLLTTVIIVLAVGVVVALIGVGYWTWLSHNPNFEKVPPVVPNLPYVPATPAR